MDVKISPFKLDGVIEAVSNKAHAHRVFVASVLARSQTEITLKTSFEDIKETIDYAKALEYEIENVGDKFTVYPAEEIPETVDIDSGNSLPAFKFMMPVYSAFGVDLEACLSEKLEKKLKIEECACLNGVKIKKSNGIFAMSGKLKAGTFYAEDIKGSWLVSGLMMALAVVDGDSEIICDENIKNKIYFRQTISVMRGFGVRVEETERGIKIFGNQEYKAFGGSVKVEGDYTASAFIMGANVFGNRVRITGLNPESVQTDKKIKDLLLTFNAKGTTFDMTGQTELIYVLTACACFAFSNTQIKGCPTEGEEGKSFMAFVNAINKMGATATLCDGTLTVEGKAGIKGGVMVDCVGDAKIAITCSLMATVSEEPITLLSVGSANKLYPNFFNEFKMLGGKCQVF